jgi:hypothetical protein
MICLRIALSASLLAACGAKAPAHSGPGRSVVLSEDSAPSGYVEVQNVSAKSGKGCGVFGDVGSREAAEQLLRDAAAKLGASYVRVTSVESPRPNHQCIEHEYSISGVAYRSPAAAEPVPPASSSPAVAAAAAASAAPAATPPASPRVCVPGGTQACLGAGACQGAQACRDDASGFLPCDCGTPPL